MSTPPLASICVPLLNKKDYVAKTLEAILAQTYAPLEVVVSDNGSTDGSSAIAQEFARRDSRVRYYRLEHNLNINESWRYCWRLAKGEFLKIHSADDPTLPADFLQRMIEPMLRAPELEFTVCPMQAVVEYAWVGMSAKAQQQYFDTVAQNHRRLTSLPKGTKERIRLLLQSVCIANWLGTPYGVVCKRSCLPEPSWRKTMAPFGCAEGYPDWDFNMRLFLNHRGFFVDNVRAFFHYDANHAYARAVVDNLYEFFGGFNELLYPLTILTDPQLSAIRREMTPTELESLLKEIPTVIQKVMEVSDEVVAFDSPENTASVLPRLEKFADIYRQRPAEWNNTKRLRQLRMRLVAHWLNTRPEQIRQEYYGDVGRAHRVLLESGLRRAELDIREKDVLEKTHAALSTGLAGPASWGSWLALVLLINIQFGPNFRLELVPDWLRQDFAKYASTV